MIIKGSTPVTSYLIRTRRFGPELSVHIKEICTDLGGNCDESKDTDLVLDCIKHEQDRGWPVCTHCDNTRAYLPRNILDLIESIERILRSIVDDVEDRLYIVENQLDFCAELDLYDDLRDIFDDLKL